MTLGKMPKISTPTLALTSYRTETMISTLRRTSTADIQMLPSEPTLLPLAHNLPDDRGLVNSQQGH